MCERKTRETISTAWDDANKERPNTVQGDWIGIFVLWRLSAALTFVLLTGAAAIAISFVSLFHI